LEYAPFKQQEHQRVALGPRTRDYIGVADILW